MSSLRIALVYFSATDVTRTYAGLVERELCGAGCEVRSFDVTAHASRCDKLPVAEFDALLFGFPVYADFAPSAINDWIPTLDGQEKRCGMFFTYGGRTTGYAHFHTKGLLEGAGFRVLLSAEFLGRHSFNVAGWRALPDRPDGGDFAVARDYAALALDRFLEDVPTPLALQRPFGYDAVLASRRDAERSAFRGWSHPFRSAPECSMCRACETECPTLAFDADAGQADPLKCIECMRCIYICPDQVLEVDPRMKEAWPDFLRHFHLTEEMMRQKRSKIITEAWQAAS